MKSIKDIDITTIEGRLLFSAMAIITSECRTDKQPDEVLAELIERSKTVFPEDEIPTSNDISAELDYSKEWPNSSNIKQTAYNPTTNHLDVTFKNGLRYRYYDVPESEWISLKQAESIGKYINLKIKGTYQSQNLDKRAEPSNILNAESAL